MKTKREVSDLRCRLIADVKAFGEQYGFAFSGKTMEARELFSFALGALAATNNVLEVEYHENLEKALIAIEKDIAPAP